MFGKNPIRSPEKGDGSQLKVQEIFPTLQGEGPHTGVPAIFIRLGGCNLACSFCDTEFETFEEMPLADIMDEVEWLAEGDTPTNLIVITGGEPLRQNIAPLCEALLAAGYLPQIETNGTLWRELPQGVEVICSPKAPNGEYFALREDIIPRITALKFIISKSRAPYQFVPEYANNLPVWVQPMDEYDATRNQENLEYALTLAQQNGYKVSLQTHKMFGID